MKSQARLSFYLTLKYLQRGRKWTLVLIFILMSVAFVNLIFISSLFTGIIDGANKQIVDTMTGNIYMTPSDGQDFINNKDNVLKKIADVNGVKSVSARTQVPARLSYKNIRGNWQILAINPENEKQVSIVADKMIEGSFLNVDDENQIVVGRQIAGGDNVEENAFSFKGAKVGEKVTLLFDGMSEEFTIKGIFNTKFVESDKRAFISEKELNKLIPSTKDKASMIAIKTDTKDETKVLDRIKALNLDANIYSWQEATGLMKSVASSFLNVNVLITLVGILITAVTVFIVIYVDIVNKRKQIGILRAIGIKPYIIISSYVILSAVYSVIGVLIGSVVFYFVLVPYFNAHPFSLPICDATLILSKADYISRAEMIMWVSVISGLIPSAIITRTKMLDAISGR